MTEAVLFAVVEIMGRRTRAGLISDAQVGGATMLRIEHPSEMDHTGQLRTEYYAPQAIFAIQPCSREDAEAIAKWAWPGPRTEQPALGPGFVDFVDDDDDDDFVLHDQC